MLQGQSSVFAAESEGHGGFEILGFGGLDRSIGNVDQYDFDHAGKLFAYTVDAADRLGNDTYLLDPETGETGVLNTGAVDYVEGLQVFHSAKRNGKEVIILFYGTTPPAVMPPWPALSGIRLPVRIVHPYSGLGTAAGPPAPCSPGAPLPSLSAMSTS